MNTAMFKYLLRVVLLVIFSLSALLLFRYFAEEQKFIIDASGLSAFASMFGALYGVVAAFILFTVWSQFNNTSGYIEAEANALKQLYRFIILLRDGKVAGEMREAIEKYAKLVIDVGFKSVATGERDQQTSEAFNQIFLKLKQIEAHNGHKQLILEQILKQFKEVADIRTKRLTESLNRLPNPMKVFLITSSLFVIFSFAFPIFQNLSVAIFIMGVLSGSIGLLLQVIFDLDNPFAGYWNLTPGPFERFLKFLESE